MAKPLEYVAEIEAIIYSGEPFTFGELCKAGPWDEGLADRVLQQNRKKGMISFVRFGLVPRWALTDAGVAEKARRTGGAS